ncbi:hypothetical protein FRX31_014628, partial [Thalictrum thalictroides]
LWLQIIFCLTELPCCVLLLQLSLHSATNVNTAAAPSLLEPRITMEELLLE